ncbi:hypothetical protein GCM10010178_40070 [Lentzea flava]|uniref:Transcriptional regulator, TetR family n=2 Tax=Lentzea flava TaxID=103732 RepID=A0ABQ2UNY5_9PSEU|nr:transcriptional regulator, TetR family [Lentzea flava]GGU43521.1 hypothetical protein GCM10010178_40070 [Lentzea flava]
MGTFPHHPASHHGAGRCSPASASSRQPIELLDTAGGGALTVRALTERLSTGSGAIYHHVGTMNELLEAATDTVIADALATPSAEPTALARGLGAAGTPEEEIRAVALGLFDAVTEHPWGAVTLRVFESIGRPMHALGVLQRDWFATTSTMGHYFLGATAQKPARRTAPATGGRLGARPNAPSSSTPHPGHGRTLTPMTTRS